MSAHLTGKARPVFRKRRFPWPLFFNVGVELGQLLFIATVLTLVALGQHIRIPFPPWAKLVPPYVIGSVAMFWVIQRIAAF